MTISRNSPAARPAAVAGLFYPGGREALRSAVAGLLGSVPEAARQPKALIVPHAGYEYSGAVAASAYRLLSGHASAIQRVVLLGPAHRVPLVGLAAPTVGAFETPLGRVAIDQAAIDTIMDLPHVQRSDLPHQGEHSLEVQLPFLQVVLPGARLVPLVVGSALAETVAAVVRRLWDGPETLLVVSSDLSHYHGYREARDLDSATSQRILSLTGGLAGEQACGCYAINGLLGVARARHMAVKLADLRNSGDTSGEKTRVVGYGAYAFYER